MRVHLNTQSISRIEIKIFKTGETIFDQKRTLPFSTDLLFDQILKKVDSLFDQKRTLPFSADSLFDQKHTFPFSPDSLFDQNNLIK